MRCLIEKLTVAQLVKKCHYCLCRSKEVFVIFIAFINFNFIAYQCMYVCTRDLRFSRRWRCRCWSCGLWRWCTCVGTYQVFGETYCLLLQSITSENVGSVINFSVPENNTDVSEAHAAEGGTWALTSAQVPSLNSQLFTRKWDNPQFMLPHHQWEPSKHSKTFMTCKLFFISNSFNDSVLFTVPLKCQEEINPRAKRQPIGRTQTKHHETAEFKSFPFCPRF
jgi:hypothetical protein